MELSKKYLDKNKSFTSRDLELALDFLDKIREKRESVFNFDVSKTHGVIVLESEVQVFLDLYNQAVSNGLLDVEFADGKTLLFEFSVLGFSLSELYRDAVEVNTDYPDIASYYKTSSLLLDAFSTTLM